MSTTAFPVNPQLTAIAIAYRNPAAAMIADLVLPRRPTAKKFTYTRYSAEQGYTIPDTRVGRKSEPTQVDFGGTPVNDEVFDYGLDDTIPNDEIEAFNAMPKARGAASPDQVSAMMLTHLLGLDRERRVAALIFNAASYAGANSEALVGTAQWNDTANSDPVAKIGDSIDKPLIRPNTLVLGRAVWTTLRSKPPPLPVTALRAELAAGTAIPEPTPDQAIFESFELRTALH
jgi:hypothetical protein